MIVVEGGKFTTSRSLAKKVVNKIISKNSFQNNKTNSKKIFLKGCEIPNFCEFVLQKQMKYNNLQPNWVDFLCKSYGTEIDNLMEIYNSSEHYKKILNRDGENLAQVVYAIKYEMARSLTDIVQRRTSIAQTGDCSQEIIQIIADVAAKELKWSKEFNQNKIEDFWQQTTLPKME